MRSLKLLVCALGLGVAAVPALAEMQVNKALVVLTSASLQTQGMAMVLANAMQERGASVDVLLCDAAGNLALKDTVSETLKPRNVTPEQLLKKLQKGGAQVNVCALYLPNSGQAPEALRDGVGVAKPPVMAAQMMDAQTRVFNY